MPLISLGFSFTFFGGGVGRGGLVVVSTKPLTIKLLAGDLGKTCGPGAVDGGWSQPSGLNINGHKMSSPGDRRHLRRVPYVQAKRLSKPGLG